jgi:hypothetical protein
MEIQIPLSEFEADHPNVGDFGEITLKVEVMEIGQEHMCVLKHGPIKITKPFKEMDMEEMKNRIGTVEDTEMPMQKDSTPKESE